MVLIHFYNNLTDDSVIRGSLARQSSGIMTVIYGEIRTAGKNAWKVVRWECVVESLCQQPCCHEAALSGLLSFCTVANLSSELKDKLYM